MEEYGMNAYGWAMFIISNVVVLVLTGYCFYHVITLPKEHMHAPLDIDTHDLDSTGEDEEDGL